MTSRITITGLLTLETGMHIGAGKDSFKIGGVDNPVIKDKHGLPYIPGSSLKGKLRSLLEKSNGIMASRSDGKLASYNSNNGEETLIAILFGPADSNTRDTPLVALFRDAFIENPEYYLNEKTGRVDNEKLDGLYELKNEVQIDRISGTTKEGLRTIERVVPGIRFKVEIVLNLHYLQQHITHSGHSYTLHDFLSLLEKGFELLADDYLGGSGSRGYGKVDVSDILRNLKSIKTELSPK